MLFVSLLILGLAAFVEVRIFYFVWEIRIESFFLWMLKKPTAYPIMCRTIYYDNPNERRVEEFFQPWPMMQPMYNNDWQPSPRDSPSLDSLYSMEPNNRLQSPQPDSPPQPSPAYYVEPIRPRMPCPSQQQQPIINRMPASKLANTVSQQQPPSIKAPTESYSKLESSMAVMIELLQKIVRKLWPEEDKSVVVSKTTTTSVGATNRTASP